MKKCIDTTDLTPNKYSSTLGLYCEVDGELEDAIPIHQRQYVNVCSKEAALSEMRSYWLTKENEETWQLFYVDDRLDLRDIDFNLIPELKNILASLSTTKKPETHEIKVIEDLLNQYKPEELLILGSEGEQQIIDNGTLEFVESSFQAENCTIEAEQIINHGTMEFSNSTIITNFFSNHETDNFFSRHDTGTIAILNPSINAPHIDLKADSINVEAALVDDLTIMPSNF